jgi:hypothetical protein
MAIGSLNYHMGKSQPPINGTFGSMWLPQMKFQVQS